MPAITTSDTVIYVPGKIVSSIVECKAPVRWNKDVLEQLHYIQHIGTAGHVESMTEEWRPVPEAEDS